jgi:hypothetical protein
LARIFRDEEKFSYKGIYIHPLQLLGTLATYNLTVGAYSFYPYISGTNFPTIDAFAAALRWHLTNEISTILAFCHFSNDVLVQIFRDGEIEGEKKDAERRAESLVELVPFRSGKQWRDVWRRNEFGLSNFTGGAENASISPVHGLELGLVEICNMWESWDRREILCCFEIGAIPHVPSWVD